MPQLKSDIIAATPAVMNVARGLIISSSSEVQAVVAEALRLQGMSCDYAVSAEECEKKMSRQRFEALFVDSELPNHGIQYLQQLRSKSVSKFVMIALTYTNEATSQAFSYGAQFCVQGRGAMQRIALERVLRAAYGSILRERRRYFRCPLNHEFTAQCGSSGPSWNGKLANISEGGICFIAPLQLTPGQLARVRLRLPDTSTEVSADCRVQWVHVSGRAGAQFVSMHGESKQNLYYWLATQFEVTLSTAVVPQTIL